MKKIKLLPSVLMLALCMGILGIGIYAATPTNNVITGTITVNAANAGITVEVYKGTDTSVEPIGTDTGRASTRIDLTGENAINIDASEAESLSEVEPAVYTIRLSTTSSIKLVVDTETIEWRDGTTATGTITDALKITKVHTPSATDDTTGLAYFTNEKPYIITCSINLTDLHEEDFTSNLNMTINVHKLSDWTAAGNTGINGIDYLHLGEYPQTRVATSTDGYTETDDEFLAYNDSAQKTSLIETTRKIYTKDGERFVYLDSVWNQDEHMSESATNLYRIEPLKWSIKDITDNGDYLLLCDIVVEQVHFQQFYDGEYAIIDGVTSGRIYANNYYYSTLRKFMNETFYTSAFSDAERVLIQKTMVKNDDASMGGTDDNNYSCENLKCNDYIFALSYEETLMPDYGFVTSTGFSDTRKIASSDYAKDTGVCSNNGSGYWWLRSPYSSGANRARCVTDRGGVSNISVSHYNPGCVPALLLGL